MAEPAVAALHHMSADAPKGAEWWNADTGASVVSTSQPEGVGSIFQGEGWGEERGQGGRRLFGLEKDIESLCGVLSQCPAIRNAHVHYPPHTRITFFLR